ncbi:MAG: hypothetical protein PVH65_05505 [Chloroflexota bacterium]|jgi:hypothetical protein
MTRWLRFSSLLLVLFLFLLILSACGGEQAEPLADTPLPPADTPVPPTETPVPPTPTPMPPTATPTPEPTPTPQMIDPSALALPEDLDTFVLTQSESWDGVGPDGEALSYGTDLTAQFVRDPEALYVRAMSDDPDAAEAMQLMGSADGSLEIYFIGGLLYAPIMGGWMQIPVDVPGTMIQADEVPFNPTNVMDEAFGEFATVVQWLESAEYQGEETFAGMAVERYAVDESSFNLDRLPAGMAIEAADGQLYVMAEGGALVGLELTISGIDLALEADQDQVTLSEGTVTYGFELSDINEPLTIELPEEALLTTQLPEDIPLPEEALQAGVFNMMGFQFFSFLIESPAEDVAAFYRGAMPENGWSEAGVTEAEGDYSLTFTKDDRVLEISIFAEAQPGYTGIEITPNPAGQ